MARIAIGAAMAFLSGIACGTPTAPSDPGGGVTIFSDPDYRGESVILGRDVDDLTDLRGGCSQDYGGYSYGYNWNDCISSVRLKPGWSVTLYEDTRYRGASRTFTDDVIDLDDMRGPCGDDWDDCASSLRVTPP